MQSWGERGCVGSHEKGLCQGTPRDFRIASPTGHDDSGTGEERKELYG